MGKRKLDSGKSQPKISNVFSKAEASGSKSFKSSNDTVSQYCLSLNNNETREKPEEIQKETEIEIEPENSAPEAATAPPTSSG